MRIPEVLFFYLLIGAAVAVLAHRQTGELSVVSTLLWPLWLPALMAPSTARYETAPAREPARPPAPEALRRLERLLVDWDPELVPSLETLRVGLSRIEARHLALAAELERPENDLEALERRAVEASPVGAVHRRRRDNVVAMRALHDQLELELRTSLAQVEELSSRVQLARFSGATVEGVGTQLDQLVAAIEGVREVELLGKTG